MTADNAKTVLLVDDNESMRRLVRHLFESAGFICEECKDGAEAVEKATRLKPDIIVLDYSMPVMNGIQAAQLLKGKLPEVPILMFSLYASAALAELAMAAGVAAVVSKEESATHLIAKAHALLSVHSRRADV
jgi:CheY-like chemotaxis protein